jgi:hypothetical protein
MPPNERSFSSPPAMLPLFARAGAAMLPGVSRLPFIGGGGAPNGMAAPELTLTLPDVTVDRQRLAAYDRVCGFGLRDALPATYPHMLAFPLHLTLMIDPSFPFGAIGLVHIYNRITQHRPIDAAETLAIKVWCGAIRPHPRGRQFDVLTEARVGDELVWEEVSTNLKRGSGSDESAPTAEVPSAKDLPAAAFWKPPGALGRRYGSVSGDLNPIHIHPLTARLFGFPSAIAHGMWTKARCLAALEERLPPAFTVEVAFKRPILLPATVTFAEAGLTGPPAGIAFGVRDKRKDTPHLDGRVSSV